MSVLDVALRGLRVMETICSVLRDISIILVGRYLMVRLVRYFIIPDLVLGIIHSHTSILGLHNLSMV